MKVEVIEREVRLSEEVKEMVEGCWVNLEARWV